MRLTDSQRRLLASLLYHESFETLETETGLGYGVIRDDLMTLVHKGMIEVFDEHRPDEWVRTQAYDTDQLRQYRFRASSRGLREIRPA